MYSHFYYLYFLFFSLYYLFYFCLSYLNNNTNYILTCLLKWILLIELPLYNKLFPYKRFENLPIPNKLPPSDVNFGAKTGGAVFPLAVDISIMDTDSSYVPSDEPNTTSKSTRWNISQLRSSPSITSVHSSSIELTNADSHVNKSTDPVSDARIAASEMNTCHQTNANTYQNDDDAMLKDMQDGDSFIGDISGVPSTIPSDNVSSVASPRFPSVAAPSVANSFVADPSALNFEQGEIDLGYIDDIYSEIADNLPIDAELQLDLDLINQLTDAEQSSSPLVRTISSVTDTKGPPPKRTYRDLGAIFKVLKDASMPSGTNTIPTTFNQAMKSPDVDFWDKAIAKELDAHAENHTWDIVELTFT